MRNLLMLLVLVGGCGHAGKCAAAELPQSTLGCDCLCGGDCSCGEFCACGRAATAEQYVALDTSRPIPRQATPLPQAPPAAIVERKSVTVRTDTTSVAVRLGPPAVAARGPARPFLHRVFHPFARRGGC